MSKSTAQFSKDKVIPDVLEQGTALDQSTLVIKWPNATLDAPGKELDRQATQPEPTLSLDPAPEESHDDYVLIMTDPDLMTANDTGFGQVRHWLAVNVSVKPDGQLEIPKEGNVSPYVGPAPLPNYVSPRPHRYVFILSRPYDSQSGPVSISNDELRDLQNEYPAFEGSQELQDLKDRWAFDAQKLMNKKKLKTVAATYMFVGGNLQSTVDNLGMTAKAAADKVMGT